jgi:hypothetical protein
MEAGMCGGALGLLNGGRGALIQRGGKLAQARERRWGKVAKGALLRFFYKGESLGVRRATSQINSPMQSKIRAGLVRNRVGYHFFCYE